jgi:hypothetical protein
MSDQFIGKRAGDAVLNIRITGMKELQAKLAKLGPLVKRDCEIAAANYLLLQIVKDVPPWKKVTRRSVYGVPFQSDKQRRWFFFALSHGMIDVPYRRRGKSGGIASRWHIQQTKNNVFIYNDDPAAVYVYDDMWQNKLVGRIGWRTINVIVASKAKQLDRVLDRAAKASIKRQGLA